MGHAAARLSASVYERSEAVCVSTVHLHTARQWELETDLNGPGLTRTLRSTFSYVSDNDFEA